MRHHQLQLQAPDAAQQLPLLYSDIGESDYSSSSNSGGGSSGGGFELRQPLPIADDKNLHNIPRTPRSSLSRPLPPRLTLQLPSLSEFVPWPSAVPVVDGDDAEYDLSTATDDSTVDSAAPLLWPTDLGEFSHQLDSAFAVLEDAAAQDQQFPPGFVSHLDAIFGRHATVCPAETQSKPSSAGRSRFRSAPMLSYFPTYPTPGEEHKPGRKRRRGEDGYIPRPPNAFMLYRRDHHQKVRETLRTLAVPVTDNVEISVQLGKNWKSESDSVKQLYFDLAVDERQKHQEMYPDYKYRPQHKKSKKLPDRQKSIQQS